MSYRSPAKRPRSSSRSGYSSLSPLPDMPSGTALVAFNDAEDVLASSAGLQGGVPRAKTEGHSSPEPSYPVSDVFPKTEDSDLCILSSLPHRKAFYFDQAKIAVHSEFLDRTIRVLELSRGGEVESFEQPGQLEDEARQQTCGRTPMLPFRRPEHRRGFRFPERCRTGVSLASNAPLQHGLCHPDGGNPFDVSDAPATARIAALPRF